MLNAVWEEIKWVEQKGLQKKHMQGSKSEIDCYKP